MACHHSAHMIFFSLDYRQVRLVLVVGVEDCVKEVVGHRHLSREGVGDLISLRAHCSY